MKLGVRARTLISDRIDEFVAEISSTLLQDQIYIADDGDGAIIHLARAAADAQHAEDITHDPRADETPVHDGAKGASAMLEEALTHRIEENVAMQCAEVIEHADEWAETWDADRDFEAAKREARSWLLENRAIAARADVLDTVEIAA